MSQRLTLGSREVVVLRPGEAVPADHRALSAYASANLRAHDPRTVATIRSLVAGEMGAAAISRWTEHQILRQFQLLLERGRLRLALPPGKPGEHAVGGAKKDKPEAAEAEPPPEETVVKTTDWIEIVLVDETGKPLKDQRYRLTLADGSVKEGKLDANGSVRHDSIPPGFCKLVFPDIDKESWTRA